MPGPQTFGNVHYKGTLCAAGQRPELDPKTKVAKPLPPHRVTFNPSDLSNGTIDTGTSYTFTHKCKSLPILAEDDARFFLTHGKAIKCDVTGVKAATKKVEQETIEVTEGE